EKFQKMASLPEWSLVVVGDEKTPADWSLPGVHFLSTDIQAAMSVDFGTMRMPTINNSRKNAGYLYAISNGAEWIYDTEDDNELFGKGLDQFDYSTKSSRGLRFAAPDWHQNTVSRSLFNPYRHFGRADVFPRGFPLEFAENHDHHDSSYRLCRVQRPPVVQQVMLLK
ncbi:hypothetical protein PMAYCL1PPCAC_32975, partial [Pristionchus mayeri]